MKYLDDIILDHIPAEKKTMEKSLKPHAFSVHIFHQFKNLHYLKRPFQASKMTTPNGVKVRPSNLGLLELHYMSPNLTLICRDWAINQEHNYNYFSDISQALNEKKNVAPVSLFQPQSSRFLPPFTSSANVACSSSFLTWFLLIFSLTHRCHTFSSLPIACSSSIKDGI